MKEETAWLIEETWSGYVHYVHRSFDALRWERECRSDAYRRHHRMTALMRVPIVSKDIAEAMLFPSKERAESWLSVQPRWMREGDQYQIREHIWLDSPKSPPVGHEMRP